MNSNYENRTEKYSKENKLTTAENKNRVYRATTLFPSEEVMREILGEASNFNY